MSSTRNKQYNQELMKNTGLKERQRRIVQQMKIEERRLADLNKSKLEELEKEAKIKQAQVKYALAQEYENTIKEKSIKRKQDYENSLAMEQQNYDIGAKLSLKDSQKEMERKQMERQYRLNIGECSLHNI